MDDGWGSGYRSLDVKKKRLDSSIYKKIEKLNAKISHDLSELDEYLEAIEPDEHLKALQEKNKTLDELLSYVMENLDQDSREDAIQRSWGLREWWEEHNKKKENK